MYPLRRMWSQIAPVFLELKGLALSNTSQTQLLHEIEQFYFKGQNVRQVSLNVLSSVSNFYYNHFMIIFVLCTHIYFLFQMVSDRYLNFGIVKGVQAHTLLGAPTYMYLFSYSEGKHNLANAIGYQSREWGGFSVKNIRYFLQSYSYFLRCIFDFIFDFRCGAY